MTNTNELEKVKQLYRSLEAIEKQTNHRHSIGDIFSDFCILAMTSLHNQLYSIGKTPIPNCYKETHDELEAEYLATIAKYSGSSGDKSTKETISLFVKTLADLVGHMRWDPHDYLGDLYMQINANSKCKGQYFTPPHICDMAAEMIIGGGDDFEKAVRERGFYGVSDSCCGSGAMAMGVIKVLGNRGIEDMSGNTLFILQDIDITCVRMAYINMCLLGVSARITWGNSLIDDGGYPFFDTPCLQIAFKMGLFQGKKNKQEKEENIESKENKEVPKETKQGNGSSQGEITAKDESTIGLQKPTKQLTLFDFIDNP